MPVSPVARAAISVGYGQHLHSIGSKNLEIDDIRKTVQTNPADLTFKGRPPGWTLSDSIKGLMYLLLKCSGNRFAVRQILGDRVKEFLAGIRMKVDVNLHRTVFPRRP